MVLGSLSEENLIVEDFCALTRFYVFNRVF